MTSFYEDRKLASATGIMPDIIDPAQTTLRQSSKKSNTKYEAAQNKTSAFFVLTPIKN